MDAIVPATATRAAQTPAVGEADFGTRETGKVADLIMLNANGCGSFASAVQRGPGGAASGMARAT